MKNTQRWIVVLFALLALMVMLIVPAAFAGTPSGSGPSDPMLVTGRWQSLAAGASNWFYFDYTADGSSVEVDLDDNHVGGFQVAIYTPAQAKDWIQDPSGTKPVGIGTQPGAQTAAGIHDLVWLGAFHDSGRYYAVVTNQNASQADFRLEITGMSVMLAPTPTATPYPTPLFNTPAPTVAVSGKFVFMDASGGNIYTVNGDGSNLTRLTYGLDPSWSPDGTQIAFSRWNDPAGLYVMNADGTYLRPLFAWQQLLSPEWSPDGSMIAFSRQYGGNLDTITKTILNCRTVQPRPGEPAPATPEVRCSGHPQTYAANPLWTIGVVNVADGTLVEPKTILNGHAFSPSWNADNSTIAYADAGYGVVQTDTKADEPSTLFSQMPTVQSVSWSPDGTQIAFEVRQHDHWEVAVMNADGSNEHSVTVPNPLAWGPVNNVAPRWSPDGKQILFMSDRNGRWEFFLINPDGTGIQQVLKNVTDSISITYNFNNERMIDWTQK